MDVVTDNGAPTRIQPGQRHEIGRANGVDSSDKTISRRHLSLSVAGAMSGEESRLQFEVLGRNPIYVYRNNEVKIYRRFGRGEMGNGDMFCVSGKNPVWYSVRTIQDCAKDVRRNVAQRELAGEVESDFEIKGVEDLDKLDLDVDISGLDPVKEFGFVVEGHEFDSYPKKMMRDIKNWDWFIEEEGRNGEDDDGEGKKVKGKRKRGGENDDDDEWSGDSEDERVLMGKSRKAGRGKYVTRSKDRGEHSKMSSTRTENRDIDDEDEDDGDGDEDEDDETLGGFVVDDQNLEEDEDDALEEEEEEDFEDEDEDEDE